MQKLTAADPETKSPDLAAENLAALRALFPELITEGADGVAVNLDVLKQLVGDKTVTDAEEKYGLNWHGKRRARQLALTPSLGTLRPCPEESVDWDTTQNLMIEGDNLEVLKLLQKSYAGKVKLIYIDPPYNTGKDFVYPDNFQDNIKNYHKITGQTGEGGKKLTTNTEASGRFHTDWLNMMYPRLKAAHSLLSPEGFCAISIGDEEISSLRLIMNELYGEDNHRNTLAVRRFDKNLSRQFMDNGLPSLSVGFEYLVVYSKDSSAMFNPVFKQASEERQTSGYWKGFWNAADRPTMRFELLGVKPNTGQWKWKRDTALEAVKNYEEFIRNHSSRVTIEEYWDKTGRDKKFIRRNRDGKGVNQGVEHWVAPSTGILRSSNWTDLLSGSTSSFGIPFNNPKSVGLLQELILMTTGPGDIVLDFFAGSGTTSVAVFYQNSIDELMRKSILVQLPEPIDIENKDQQAAADFCNKLDKPCTISELTKERLRLAGKQLKEKSPLLTGDYGFRVFKLDTSNVRAWDPERDKLMQTLQDSVEHLKADRTELDILFELLLKLGLDLCVPIETKKIVGEKDRKHEVHSVGAGSLLVCLSPAISQDDVEPLALGIVEWHKALNAAGESTVVFRDSSFADDVAKTNLTAILNQHGIETVRSL